MLTIHNTCKLYKRYKNLWDKLHVCYVVVYIVELLLWAIPFAAEKKYVYLCL